ncbi:unnamed protein product [Protopolystoma xenopodis]|uniref:Uncharacterized protein n=1 Tax=Protopolystoma xenopodis TaxID=117903 RepID=A0A3S5BRP0_9PLAT|nr:unnamed protein product [Protopolystoma xenopodis]
MPTVSGTGSGDDRTSLNPLSCSDARLGEIGANESTGLCESVHGPEEVKLSKRNAASGGRRQKQGRGVMPQRMNRQLVTCQFVQLSLCAYDAGETCGNVPSQRSSAGTHEHSGRGHGTRSVA